MKFFITGISFLTRGIVSLIWHFLIGLYTILTIFPKYFVIGIEFIFGKKKKGIKEKKSHAKLILAMTTSVYLICVFLISRWYVQGLKIKYLTNDIINSTEIIEIENDDSNLNIDNPDDNSENPDSNNNTGENDNNSQTYYPNDYWDYLSVPLMNVNFDELLDKNSDTVGWIKVEGTKVNYPVVQSDDNEYYLKHAFNKRSNMGGWIFADYRVDFEDFGRNTIIYGHNMNNKTMFGSIPSMLNNSYLSNSNNHFIKVSTPSSNSTWKVFSVYTISPETYYLKTIFNDDTYEEFLNTIKERSIYNFGIDADVNDKILTLSTCDNTGTKRVVVHAKMVNIAYK